jgi:hypothetical protein
LRERGILSDPWLEEQNIDIETVLGRNATVHGLRHLCTILDERLNGNIFPLDFESRDAPGEEHIEQVAAIFKGDRLLPRGGRQLSLPDFQAYDLPIYPLNCFHPFMSNFFMPKAKDRE